VISATITLYADNEHVEYLEEAALREQEISKFVSYNIKMPLTRN
jgi:hypothetical protein